MAEIMKRLWYLWVKYYVRFGFAFYFKKVKLLGLDHIPQKKPVLFVANHQNALIDPLLIGSFSNRELHFLTRGDVFSRPLIKQFLSTVNMIPIFRIRDGRDNMSKNEEIFKKCFKILNDRGTLLIFPEGNHNIQRRVRPISKGFTRIVFGAKKLNPALDLVVLPVGINYSNAKKYASSVSIHFGKPIDIDTFWKQDQVDLKSATNALRKSVSESMKKLVTHIEDINNHDLIQSRFKEEDFLNPTKVNEKLKQKLQDTVGHNTNTSNHPLRPIVMLNSILPMSIWRYIYPKISEPEFVSTFKFGLGITLFPITYVLQSLVIGLFFGANMAVAYFILSVTCIYLLTKTS